MRSPRRAATPLMWKTGHSLIKSKMAETGSPLAGEMSGHIFFADRWYGFDDALYAAVRTLGIIARMAERLSAVRKALPHVINTPEVRFDCDDRRKFAVIAGGRGPAVRGGRQGSATDGVRVQTADGWWLLRASNTQAVLVARCEAGTPAGLDAAEGGAGQATGGVGIAGAGLLRRACGPLISPRLARSLGR